MLPVFATDLCLADIFNIVFNFLKSAPVNIGLHFTEDFVPCHINNTYITNIFCFSPALGEIAQESSDMLKPSYLYM